MGYGHLPRRPQWAQCRRRHGGPLPPERKPLVALLISTINKAVTWVDVLKEITSSDALKGYHYRRHHAGFTSACWIKAFGCDRAIYQHCHQGLYLS